MTFYRIIKQYFMQEKYLLPSIGDRYDERYIFTTVRQSIARLRRRNIFHYVNCDGDGYLRR